MFYYISCFFQLTWKMSLAVPSTSFAPVWARLFPRRLETLESVFFLSLHLSILPSTVKNALSCLGSSLSRCSLCWSCLLFIAIVFLFARLRTTERKWWNRDGNPPNQKNLPLMRICCPPSKWNRETGKWYVIHESSASGEATGWCKDDPACQQMRA